MRTFDPCRPEYVYIIQSCCMVVLTITLVVFIFCMLKFLLKMKI